MANRDNDNDKFNERTKNICNKYHNKYTYLSGFVYYLKSTQKSPRTIYYYIVHIIEFLNAINKPVEEITLDDYNWYIAQNEHLSSSNLIIKYSAISKFIKYLTITDKIKKNFMEFAERPKYIETQEQLQKRESGVLTVAEIQMIIDNINMGIRNGRSMWLQKDYRSRDMAVVLVFLTTGMRSVALENLNVEDVNLEENVITVTDKENKVNIHQIPEETKIVITKWLLKREELLKQAGKEHETALFISNRKTRLSYDGIKKIVCKYCSTVTGKNITPHKLRATYGTILYNQTHDIEFVRKQMNHANIATTQRYIRGTGKADREKAANIMGGIISNRKSNDNLFDINMEESDG